MRAITVSLPAVNVHDDVSFGQEFRIVNQISETHLLVLGIGIICGFFFFFWSRGSFPLVAARSRFRGVGGGWWVIDDG